MKTLQGHSVRGPSVLNPLFFRNFAHGLPRGRQAQRRGHRPGSPAASQSGSPGKRRRGWEGAGGRGQMLVQGPASPTLHHRSRSKRFYMQKEEATCRNDTISSESS